MPNPQPPAVNLGPLEAEVMSIVWNEGLQTVGEVTERINQRRRQPLDYRTILTVMTRLNKKKVLRHRRRGNTYHFTATCSQEAFAARQGAVAVAALVERYGEPALAGILDQLAASPEVIARLTALLGSSHEQAG